jgi:hypothetical protein
MVGYFTLIAQIVMVLPGFRILSFSGKAKSSLTLCMLGVGNTCNFNSYLKTQKLLTAVRLSGKLFQAQLALKRIIL